MCSWRPRVDVRRHPPVFFHIVHWIRVSQSNPVLLLQIPVSAFQDWNYKWMTTPTWHLHGFMWIQTVVLTLCIKCFTSKPSLLPKDRHILFCFIFIYVYLCLPACLYLYHIYTSSQRPEEEGTCPGTGCQEPKSDHQVLFTLEPCLQPPKIDFLKWSCIM